MIDSELQRRAPTAALVTRRYDHAGGGAERWTHQHATRLLDAGWRVQIVAERITGAPPNAEPHQVDALGRWLGGSAWAFAYAAERAVTRLCPDLVVDMGCCRSGAVVIPHYGTRAANDRARLGLRGPFQRLARLASTAVMPRRRRLAALELASVRDALCVVAVSAMTAGHLRTDLGVAAERISVVPNGVDVDRFVPAGPVERASARAALGVGTRAVALVVAHDFSLKGVPTAVRAVAALHGLDPARAPLLFVVGKDSQRPVAHLAARLGVEHLVRLEGTREDVRPYYDAADALVHPTHYDPCSLVALEAAACCVPVVTTRRNGAIERLGAGEECLVLEDPADHLTLARLIASALEPGRNLDMRAAALRRRALLDDRIGHTALMEIYRGVIASRRPSRGARGPFAPALGASRAAQDACREAAK